MGLLADAVKKQQAQKSSSGSGSASSSRASSGRGSGSAGGPSYQGFSIFEDHEKNEKKFTNGSEAASYLQKCSSLFNRSVVDGSYAVNDIINNKEWRVDMDTDGDGEIEDGVAIADAIASSFDSELDLYIQEQLENIMEKYNCYNLKALFGAPDSQALKDLARLGIRADAVGDDSAWQNRTYSFSLVELPDNIEELSDEELLELVYSDDAKILEDKNGKKGSIIFSDCLIPDGIANGAEINLSSILDVMGYDCISKADFVNNPDEYYELLDAIGENLTNGAYTSSGTTIKDIYGEKTLDIATATRAVYTANGAAYGVKGWANSAISFEDNLAFIESRGLGSAGGNIISGLGASNGSLGDSSSLEDSKLDKAKEKENEKVKKEAEKILEHKINEYKQEKGEAPTGLDLDRLTREANQEAKVKA